jgi:hypothetical protein
VAVRQKTTDGYNIVADRTTNVEDIGHLIALSIKALPSTYLASQKAFAQTVRRDPSAPSGLRPEGVNLRYAAIAALGLDSSTPEAQKAVLGDLSVAELVEIIAERATTAEDPGSVALAAWAAAEILGETTGPIFDRLSRFIRNAVSIPTVDFSWTLTALVAAYRVQPTDELRVLMNFAAQRLMAAQGVDGIFPHHLPREELGRFRAHVGCFADQVYPIQALARYAHATDMPYALEAANRCAKQIVDLQGEAGQWWWHYDCRTGKVVEGFPVYSVHQHAMAPMALFDLFECGGDDHRAAIDLGLTWLRTHPESTEELIDETTGAIWRKVGRKEPAKAARKIRAVTTSLSPNFRIAALDKAFPPGPVDYECRPYELGWLLYAWQSTNTGLKGGASA